MQAGELAARARCVAHLLELSSIMKNQVITVCNSGQCYWVDSHGTRQYGMSSSVEDKLEKKDFGAWVIWNRAADSVAACVNNTHVPAVSLALKEVQREILEPPCCTQCDTELRTLLRVVTGIAAERKLL